MSSKSYHQPMNLRLTDFKLTGVLLSALVVSIVGLVILNSQSATADSESKPFEDKLWSYLIGNNYKNWAPAPGQDGDFYTGQSPHGALLKTYMNRTAIGDSSRLRPGSVVILEDYRADKSLKSISVMYRSEGFNPNGNDWYWVAYHPDGSVVKERQQSVAGADEVAVAGHAKIMGKANSCIACHENATGSDFAFFNDGDFNNMAGRPQPNSEAISTIR